MLSSGWHLPNQVQPGEHKLHSRPLFGILVPAALYDSPYIISHLGAIWSGRSQSTDDVKDHTPIEPLVRKGKTACVHLENTRCVSAPGIRWKQGVASTSRAVMEKLYVSLSVVDKYSSNSSSDCSQLGPGSIISGAIHLAPSLLIKVQSCGNGITFVPMSVRQASPSSLTRMFDC